jgi:magnesium chelatase family protein
MNPCRCGYISDAARACNKAPKCAGEYQSKISGPLLDRFDMMIDVPEVPTLDMLATGGGEASSVVANRVAEARARQKHRFESMGLGLRINAELQGDTLHETVQLEPAAQKLLEQATEKMRLSMRGYTRVLRVARTIADLADSQKVAAPHVAEAASYRQQLLGREAA